MNRKIHLYKDELIDAGVCREQAPDVPPQNMYTKYYGTVNLNNLFKFINLKLHSDAQWEIQHSTKGVLEVTKSLWPRATTAYMKLAEEK